MKKILLLVLFAGFSLSFQTPTYTLTVEIVQLRSSKGHILMEVKDSEGEVVRGISTKVKGDKCLVEIKNLKQGGYSFRYFHDENENKDIDMNWMGIPREGFGFSNKFSGTFTLAALRQIEIEVSSDTTWKSKPWYLL